MPVNWNPLNRKPHLSFGLSLKNYVCAKKNAAAFILLIVIKCVKKPKQNILCLTYKNCTKSSFFKEILISPELNNAYVELN